MPRRQGAAREVNWEWLAPRRIAAKVRGGTGGNCISDKMTNSYLCGMAPWRDKLFLLPIFRPPKK
jgi:hypothetical protein